VINAAIVGLGWWGKTLVKAVSGVCEDIKFVTGTTRSLSDDAGEFAKEHDIELRSSYEDIHARCLEYQLGGIEAVKPGVTTADIATVWPDHKAMGAKDEH
jgi:hypothetical protein